jgi:hypothetical protein
MNVVVARHYVTSTPAAYDKPAEVACFEAWLRERGIRYDRIVEGPLLDGAPLSDGAQYFAVKD